MRADESVLMAAIARVENVLKSMEADMKLKLVKTCSSCPEQYDVYHEGIRVGYMRLRYGFFRAECFGNIVYTAGTKGDGQFMEDERKRHLNAACASIMNRLMDQDTEPLYEVEEGLGE